MKMDKKEFCETMAAGHEQAARNLLAQVDRLRAAGPCPSGSDTTEGLERLAAQEIALARAFADLARQRVTPERRVEDLLEALEAVTRVDFPQRDNLAWREVVNTMKGIARDAIDSFAKEPSD